MSQPRLLFFLSDVEGNLTALRQSLRRVCEEAALPTPEVTWAEGPAAFGEAGWHIAEVLSEGAGSEGGGGAVALEGQFEAATQALSRDFRERTVGVLVDRSQRFARAALSQPGRPARTLEGEFPDVLRQAAHWLGVDALALARLLGEPRRTRNVLASPADFGSSPPASAEAGGGGGVGPSGPEPAAVQEPDEEDRFVEAKLAQARALMAQYLSAARR